MLVNYGADWPLAKDILILPLHGGRGLRVVCDLFALQVRPSEIGPETGKTVRTHPTKEGAKA